MTHILALWLIVITSAGTHVSGDVIRQPVNQAGAWLCLDQCAGQKGGIAYGGMILVLADDVTIEGEDISGGTIGIAAIGVKNLTLRGNRLSGQSAWGIYLKDVQNARVEGNWIDGAIRSCPDSPDGCESAGILGLNVQGSVISGNKCNRSGDCYYFNGEGLPSNDNYFADNTCFNSPHNCFEVTFSRGNVFRGNRALSVDGAACEYGFWLGGSTVSMDKHNESSCRRSFDRGVRDAMGSTPIPTVVHWLRRND